jgi:sulfur relay (sulfurtransferase) DsrF/TusC family protein
MSSSSYASRVRVKSSFAVAPNKDKSAVLFMEDGAFAKVLRCQDADQLG